MKKYLFSFLLLAWLSSPAKASDERTMNVNASVLRLVAGELNLQYQYKLLDFMSINIPLMGAYYWPYQAVASNFVDKGIKMNTKPWAFGAGLGVKFLAAGNGLNDTFFIEPRVSYRYEQYGFKAAVANISKEFGDINHTIGTTLNIGWDQYWDNGLMLTTSIGVGYAWFLKRDLKVPSEISDNKLLSWWLGEKNSPGRFVTDIDIRLGYSF